MYSPIQMHLLKCNFLISYSFPYGYIIKNVHATHNATIFSLETMQASIFGGRPLPLISPPNFHLLMHLLLTKLFFHILLSLFGSPKIHGKLAILCLMTNIITYKTSNVSKEIRNRLIYSDEPIFIHCMCPAVNNPMTKIIAWETITIKRTIIHDRWRSPLHVCLMWLLLWLTLMLRGFDLYICTIFYSVFTNSVTITLPNSILLLGPPSLILLLLAWHKDLIKFVATRCSNTF